MQFSVDTGGGTVTIVSDQREIAVGDCVAVENAGTGSANIRRASSALCERPEVSAATEKNLQEEAADCVAAKDAVLAADTDEDVAAAIRAARMTIGAYSVDAGTSVRLDAAGGRLGTSFSFEDDLGIDPDAWAGALDFTARVGERHRFEIEKFAFDRDGERRNTRQLNIRDDVYEVGLVLETSFDTDVTRLSYSYLFARDNNHELGVAVGVHVTDFSMGVRVAFVPLTSATEESAGTSAPLPVVGAHGAYRPFPRWTFRGQAQIFRLEAGGYDGKLNHVALEMEHDTFRHIGFGVALDYFQVDLDSTEQKFIGAVNPTFSGPRVFMRAHF